MPGFDGTGPRGSGGRSGRGMGLSGPEPGYGQDFSSSRFSALRRGFRRVTGCFFGAGSSRGTGRGPGEGAGRRGCRRWRQG